MDFEQLHQKIDDEVYAIILLCSLPPTFVWAFAQDTCPKESIKCGDNIIPLLDQEQTRKIDIMKVPHG
jgi:hypothetical protein